MKRRALILVITLLVVAVTGATSALAGEITGNGKPTPIRDKANSECAFSGLDDADDDGFGRTQNWGQIPTALRDFLRSIGIAPETLCNGHRNPQK